MFDFLGRYLCFKYFNISHHNGISSIGQKVYVWLIYVCIYVLSIFNISHHNGISVFDQTANVWHIYVCIFVLSILTFHSIMA